jgi:Ni/Co efflux regulator RcnB
MKWLFLPAAAAMSVAVAMPIWATPEGGMATHQMFAENTDRGGDKPGRRDQKNDRGAQRAPTARDAQKPARHDTSQNQRPQQSQQQKKAITTKPNPQNRPDAGQTNQRRQNQQPLLRQTNQRQQAQKQRYNWNDYRPGRRPSSMSNQRNLDQRAWHQNRQATHRFHWNTYQRPSGWYYRRWTFGMTMPSLFWSRDYWIESYWNYGLMDPPYGYVWARYGSDAILLNVETGAILRVEYGLFY